MGSDEVNKKVTDIIYRSPPIPEDPAGVKLVWVPGRNSTSHRVRFGKTDSPELRSVQSACVFETVRLEPQSTYYWRIDEITDTGVIEGKVWRFVTR